MRGDSKFDRGKCRVTYKEALQTLMPILDRVLTSNKVGHQQALFDLDDTYLWIRDQPNLDLPGQ